MTNARLDPRRHAFRAGLADARLKDRVTAAHFVDGTLKQVRHAAVPMRKMPDASLGLENEVLLGETVRVFDEADGWAWIQLERDGYVGYVPASALATEIVSPTHRVKAPGTFVYPGPSIKLPPVVHLSLGATVSVTGSATDNPFLTLTTGGHVYARHVCSVDSHARDFVEVAEQLLYTPYLWGGRTRLGLDCSALVQLALEAAGLSCPRDSDMAAAEVGVNVLVPSDLEGLRRGDLVYWRGHCGIMIDAVLLLHVNGHHMATVIEPLSQVVRRARKAPGDVAAAAREITTVRRLPEPTAARA